MGLLILNARCGHTRGHSEPGPATSCFIPTLSKCAMSVGSAWVQAALCPHNPTHTSSAQRCFQGPDSAQHCAHLPALVQGLVLTPSTSTSASPRAAAAGANGLCQSRLCGHGAARGVPQPHNNWRRVLLFNIPGIFCQG